jgi:hypothetical protein
MAERALIGLPEPTDCSLDLYASLLAAGAPPDRRTAVVSDGGGATVAVIGLRRRLGLWEPITDGVVPGVIAPAHEGRLWAALEALAVPVRINEWTGALPSRAWSRYRQPWYRISTRADFDVLWRRSSNADTIRKARNRCARAGDMTLEVDHPDAAAWTIDGWASRWKGDPMQEAALTGELRAMVDFLMPRGGYHAFRLLHDGAPIAGLNVFVAGSVLVEQTSYRLPEYDKLGVGVRLDELFFRWAAQSPYETVELGAGDYKSRWGQQAGECVSFTVCSPRVAAAAAARRFARSALRLVQRPTY